MNKAFLIFSLMLFSLCGELTCMTAQPVPQAKSSFAWGVFTTLFSGAVSMGAYKIHKYGFMTTLMGLQSYTIWGIVSLKKQGTDILTKLHNADQKLDVIGGTTNVVRETTTETDSKVDVLLKGMDTLQKNQAELSNDFKENQRQQQEIMRGNRYIKAKVDLIGTGVENLETGQAQVLKRLGETNASVRQLDAKLNRLVALLTPPNRASGYAPQVPFQT